MTDNILEMKNITKEFTGVKALSEVNFSVKRGEILCLVGENGAGKSTLMKILSGVYGYGSYSGDIVLDGETVQFKGIADSEKRGIAIIYQELALIPELSVYENIFFGHEIMKGRVIDKNETIIRAKEILKKVRLQNLDVSTKVKNLGVGIQQLIEIAKALAKNVRLLILDEPTAVLNEDDSENLLDLIRELKDQGVTCIMISHKLKEVIAIADSITVLRDGCTVCSMDCHREQISEKEIIKNMVGREIENIYPPRSGEKIGEVFFRIKDWSATDPISGREILKNININVKKGEIVGISGLMGAGRTELALSIFGNTPEYQITSGTVEINGKDYFFKNPKDAIKKGIAYVSEDRKGNGLVLIQDIRFNTTITNLEKLVNGLALHEHEENRVANHYKESMGIKAPGIEQKVQHLSGGNQQKVQLAKWLFAEPSLLILDEPTRGIDVGAKFEIYTLMNKLVEDGMSIIMISSELPEVLGMSDRIYVMSEGEIIGEIAGEEATEQKIMAMAINTREGEKND